jgi:hypothetical protein
MAFVPEPLDGRGLFLHVNVQRVLNSGLVEECGWSDIITIPDIGLLFPAWDLNIPDLQAFTWSADFDEDFEAAGMLFCFETSRSAPIPDLQRALSSDSRGALERRKMGVHSSFGHRRMLHTIKEVGEYWLTLEPRGWGLPKPDLPPYKLAGQMGGFLIDHTLPPSDRAMTAQLGPFHLPAGAEIQLRNTGPTGFRLSVVRSTYHEATPHMGWHLYQLSDLAVCGATPRVGLCAKRTTELRRPLALHDRPQSRRRARLLNSLDWSSLAIFVFQLPGPFSDCITEEDLGRLEEDLCTTYRWGRDEARACLAPLLQIESLTAELHHTPGAILLDFSFTTPDEATATQAAVSGRKLQRATISQGHLSHMDSNRTEDFLLRTLITGFRPKVDGPTIKGTIIIPRALFIEWLQIL